jgi:hypothetical protein
MPYANGAKELVEEGFLDYGVVPSEIYNDPRLRAELENYVFQGEFLYDHGENSNLERIARQLIQAGNNHGFNVNFSVIRLKPKKRNE